MSDLKAQRGAVEPSSVGLVSPTKEKLGACEQRLVPSDAGKFRTRGRVDKIETHLRVLLENDKLGN